MKNSKPLLYVLCGPPATGKSTFTKTLPSSFHIVSPDNFVYDEKGIYNWTPDRARNAWSSAYAELRSLMESRTNVVFDSTMCHAKARRKFLQEISRYPNFDEYQLVAVSLPVLPIDVLLKRNSERSPDRRVPENTIRNMLDSYSKDGPTEEEGWDKIIKE